MTTNTRQICPQSAIFLTSGCCEDTGQIGTDTLRQLGLTTGIVNGDHYPLTHEEMQFIAEEYVTFGPYLALMGYSALVNGRKYLVPTIEIPFNDHHPDIQGRMEALLEAEECLKLLEGMADRVGGHCALRTESFTTTFVHNLDLDEGFYACELFIPMTYATEHARDFESWKAHATALATEIQGRQATPETH